MTTSHEDLYVFLHISLNIQQKKYLDSSCRQNFNKCFTSSILYPAVLQLLRYLHKNNVASTFLNSDTERSTMVQEHNCS